MALDKPYLDIPGTTIFDAEQSRLGYWLNQFCMSLMKPENRARFKAGERSYLDEWPMSEEQKAAVLARDLNRCIALGGNIYFLAKIGATDGKTYQQMAASMTGMGEQEYRAMMVGGGRSVEGNRRLGEDGALVRLEARPVLGLHERHAELVQRVALARLLRIEDRRSGDVEIGFVEHVGSPNGSTLRASTGASGCRPGAFAAALLSSRCAG